VTFDFKHKVDLMGVFGLTNNANEPIKSIGFLVNECPIRNLLDYENHRQMLESITEEVEDFVIRESHDMTLIFVLIGVVVAIALFCAIYILLKNRGSLCKNRHAEAEKRLDWEEVAAKGRQVPNISILQSSTKNE